MNNSPPQGGLFCPSKKGNDMINIDADQFKMAVRRRVFWWRLRRLASRAYVSASRWLRIVQYARTAMLIEHHGIMVGPSPAGGWQAQFVPQSHEAGWSLRDVVRLLTTQIDTTNTLPYD